MKARVLALMLAGVMITGILTGCQSPPATMEEPGDAMEQGGSMDMGDGPGAIESDAALSELVEQQQEEREAAGPAEDLSDPDAEDDSKTSMPDESPEDIIQEPDAESAPDETSVSEVNPGDTQDEPGLSDETSISDVNPGDDQAEASGMSAVSEPVEQPEASGMSAVSEPVEQAEAVTVPDDAVEEIQDEMTAMAASTYQTYLPVAYTTTVRGSNNYGWIDYGNAKDGYVVVCYTGSTDKRLKCIVKGPTGTQYTYNLTRDTVTTLPLSDGSGTYSVALYENVSGTKYSKNLAQEFNAQLADEFGPFLYSNQYVDYMSAPNTRATGADLCSRAPDLLGKVNQVYSWVIKNISYDYNKAKTVQSGYLPVLDTVLANRTGICFDYAALMSGMLRSQGIPCKLVVGYAGTAYHAWISVWSSESGWIEGVIYFDGSTWQRMDPTFASSGGQSESIMQYIGNGQNYTEKYLY